MPNILTKAEVEKLKAQLAADPYMHLGHDKAVAAIETIELYGRLIGHAQQDVRFAEGRN